MYDNDCDISSTELAITDRIAEAIGLRNEIDKKIDKKVKPLEAKIEAVKLPLQQEKGVVLADMVSELKSLLENHLCYLFTEIDVEEVEVKVNRLDLKFRCKYDLREVIWSTSLNIKFNKGDRGAGLEYQVTELLNDNFRLDKDIRVAVCFERNWDAEVSLDDVECSTFSQMFDSDLYDEATASYR